MNTGETNINFQRGLRADDGNTVKNMKAFARQWCRTRANNRRTA